MDPRFTAQFITHLRPAFEAGDPAVSQKSTEAQNLACIEESYGEIVRGDMQAFNNLMAEDVELEFSGPEEGLFSGQWRGREEVLAAAARNYAMVENQQPVIRHIIAQGENVAVVARERGRIRATGREYEVSFMHLFTIRDGRISRVFGFS